MEETMDTIPEGKQPVLVCESIHPKLKDYMIMTTHKEVIDHIELAKQETIPVLKKIFVESLMNLVKYSEEELNAEYESKSQKWQDFADDVLIFYATRLILMKKHIPIKLIDNLTKESIASRKGM